MEKDLQALTNSSASKEEISKVRAEVKKLYDGLHVEFLDLRSHVWGIRMSPCHFASFHFNLLCWLRNRTGCAQVVQERRYYPPCLDASEKNTPFHIYNTVTCPQ